MLTRDKKYQKSNIAFLLVPATASRTQLMRWLPGMEFQLFYDTYTTLADLIKV